MTPDKTRNIVDQKLTESNVDDAKVGVKMIKRQGRKIKSVVGDGAYDPRKVYDAAKDVGAKVVVPPNKNSRINENGSKERNRTVQRVKKVGRRK